jgi:hypothetical protein
MRFSLVLSALIMYLFQLEQISGSADLIPAFNEAKQATDEVAFH